MPSIYQRYLQISKLPAGRFLFNKAIGLGAPFFGKIRPNVIAYRPGFCQVEMKDRWGVRNHIGTINAGALCSLAEMTGGMALDSLVDESMRWIPRGMTVAYIKKASGTITGTSEVRSEQVVIGDIMVPIVVKNSAQEIVFTAEITFYISAKK